MIHVLLADDHAMVRDGLKTLLEQHGSLHIETVENGEEAVAAAKARRPDVAVIDVRMPVMDGVDCTRALKELHPDLPVLILTTFDDTRLVYDCLAAGADAYLLKDVLPAELADAIRLLYVGGTLIPGDLARKVLRRDDGDTKGGAIHGDTHEGLVTKPSEPEDAASTEPLTARQQEVLNLIADGLTNREIAQRLHLSEGTVKNTVSEIYARLQVRDRVQAVLKALGGSSG